MLISAAYTGLNSDSRVQQLVYASTLQTLTSVEDTACYNVSRASSETLLGKPTGLRRLQPHGPCFVASNHGPHAAPDPITCFHPENVLPIGNIIFGLSLAWTGGAALQALVHL